PVLAGTWVGDYSAALYGAFGTMVALLNRENTGKGQHVDVSLLDSIFSFSRTSLPDYLMFNLKHERKSSRDVYRSPVGTFPTQDGLIYITAVTQKQFESLCHAANRSEWITDLRFETETKRLANSKELTELISKWTSSLTS